MTRSQTNAKAIALTAAVLLSAWGCAAIPPNQTPRDPFVTVEPGLAPQRSQRPAYQYSAPPVQQTYPQPTYPRQPAYSQPPYQSTPRSAPQTVPPRTPPKTFADPNQQFGPPRQTAPRQPTPQRTDKFPPPRVPSQSVSPKQSPPVQTPPAEPLPEGPQLGVPEEFSSASNTASSATSKDQPIELMIDVPDRRPVGSGAPFQLTIKNVGDELLRNVSVVCEFDEALSFPGSDLKSVTHKIPKIEGGDARDSLLTLVSETPGLHQCRFTVAVGSKTVVEKSTSVEFVSRQLDWQLHGPAERTVGSRAEFNIPLINISPRELTNLTVRVELDAALTVREMTQGGKLGDRSVTWKLDSLKPDEGLLLQLEVECREATTQACLTATVSGEDLPADDSEACLTVKPVVGLLDVRVQDVIDPVAVNDEAEFAVTIVNQGLQPAKDVAVECRWPEGFDFTGAVLRRNGKSVPLDVDVRDQTATLPRVPRLEADERLEYRLKLPARRAGAHQLRIFVTDSANPTPVEVVEPIMVHR